MNITPKHSQFELFPSSAPKSSEALKSPQPFKDLTLTAENIIVLCIIFLVVLVVSFSFGVERGKRVALNKLSQGELTASSASNQSANDPSEIVTVLGEPASTPTEVKLLATPETKEEVIQIELPEVVSEASQEKPYTIQVASFKLGKNAQKEAELLEKNGYEAYVLEKGTHSIVCVGKFSQQDEAKKFSRKLKSKYKDSLVRRM